MKRFVEDADRRQVALPPPCLDDYVTAENPVRVVEVFVDETDAHRRACRPAEAFGVRVTRHMT